MARSPAAIASTAGGRGTLATVRPRELDDRDWLVRRLRHAGTRAIAAELGVARGTVKAAIERHGIPPGQPGRRRGSSPLRLLPPAGRREPTGTITLTGTLGDLIALFQAAAGPEGPAPTEQLLAAYIVRVHEARPDPLAYEAALLDTAVTAARIAQHHRRLRGAE
jgi:hypothetical protein